MSEVICVTDRRLCRDDFILRIERLAEAQPKAIILREKDLGDDEYLLLSRRVMRICDGNGVLCILHSRVRTALEAGARALHLPMPVLRKTDPLIKNKFSCLGASCHSVQEAVEAQNFGCTYITVGHIYDTDCKKGLKGRGTEFLKEVCRALSIPVYAIGGINAQNLSEITAAGAKGAAVMSGAMTCPDPIKYISELKNIDK